MVSLVGCAGNPDTITSTQKVGRHCCRLWCMITVEQRMFRGVGDMMVHRRENSHLNVPAALSE